MPVGKVLLAEVEGTVYAVSNKCSHLGLPLVGKTGLFQAEVGHHESDRPRPLGHPIASSRMSILQLLNPGQSLPVRFRVRRSRTSVLSAPPTEPTLTLPPAM